jgi:hypothetical protein
MKILAFIAGLFLFLFTATCGNTTNTTTQTGKLELTGTIKEQGITSYQYGTHTLTTGKAFYAIKSDAVDLDEYLNKKVTVVAEKIEGYPLEGGPEYLLVLEIK